MTHRTPAHTGARSGTLVAAVAALACGAGAAVQARVNGRLSVALGAPVGASLWSFGSGWLLLVLGLALLPSARRGLRRVANAVRERRLQWWEVLGGVLGAFFVAVQSLVVPRLGVALFTIALVAGQTGNALLVDRAGLGPSGRTPPSGGRVVAALATLVGVAVASTAHGGAGGHGLPLVSVVLTVAAGAGMTVQQAINGRVNASAGDPLATSFVNFSWGLVALAIWAALELALGRLHWASAPHLAWWTLTGGAIGVCYIAALAVLVRVLGVLVTALTTLTGQLLTAVLLDVLTGAAPVNAQLLLGVAITLLAAGGAALASRRPGGTAPVEPGVAPPAE